MTGKFCVAPVVATRDLARYCALTPDNLCFDGCLKTYCATVEFSPLFEHSLDCALSARPKGNGDGLGGTASSMVLGESPAPITRPALEVLAAITRAIGGGLVLSISYVPSTSGSTEQEIVPITLADNGLRWHVRAFGRRTFSFRDFVLTRIFAFQVTSSTLLPEESATFKVQWSHEVELEVVSHPDFPRPELAMLDFSMEDGTLCIRTRGALAGYILRQWSLDCSKGHAFRSPEYRLWLTNCAVLEGVGSASFAPSYLSVKASHG